MNIDQRPVFRTECNLSKFRHVMRHLLCWMRQKFRKSLILRVIIQEDLNSALLRGGSWN